MMEQTNLFKKRTRTLTRLLGHHFDVEKMVRDQDPLDVYSPHSLLPLATYEMTVMRDVGNIPRIVSLDRDFFNRETHHERVLTHIVADELRHAEKEISVCFNTPALRSQNTTQIDMFLGRQVLVSERRAKVKIFKPGALRDDALDDFWDYLHVFHDNALDFHHDISQDYGQLTALRKHVFHPTY